MKCSSLLTSRLVGFLSLSTLWLSNCRATSDPFIYNNKNETNSSTSSDSHDGPNRLNLSNTVNVDLINDVTHLNAQDFYSARRIQVDKMTHPGWISEDSSLFQGDIFGIEVRNAITGKNFRWPDATIPYVITTSFSAGERSVIARAILEYHDKTCIRFVPRTFQTDYIVFKTTGSGCNSNVGRTGGAQVVSLDQGCVHVSLIIHELMHATGFFHEQARADRDDYVVVNWANIQDGQARNFDKLTLDQIEYLGTSYDTGSVMHYDQFAFAKDRSVPTIYSKTGSTLGNTVGFSQNDVLKINRMYRCYVNPTTTTTAATTTSTQPPPNRSTLPSTTPRPTTSQTWTDAGSTTPVPNPAPGPEDCVDTIPDCQGWSSDGFCISSVDLMTAFCKKTCGLCPDNNACTDSSPYCWQGLISGKCTTNSKFMKTFCQKSCGFC